MGKFLRNKRGFTLVEVLAALTILSIVVIPMFSFFAQAYDYTNRNKATTLSLNVAQNALTYMQKQHFKEIINIIDSSTLTFENDGKEYHEYNSTDPNYPSIVSPTINGDTFTLNIGIRKNDDYPDYLIDVIIIVQPIKNNKELYLKGVIANEKIR
ncbi:type II secretion system protein [Calidifontibacillus oryziterrae]|uniref:type II secretion system protein n=1 Tax=Calidifontibacillus oryziterrae TaxID=1191699 RepID=UPI0002DE336C|nr:type II secretion system protein [Calidifontibacillus oryziterrae]